MLADFEKSLLFYITQNHSVDSSTYDTYGWSTGFDIGIHATAPNSRHLSITSVTNSSNITTADLLLLFYESPGGNITALLGYGQIDSPICSSLRLADISSQKSMALPPLISDLVCLDSVPIAAWHEYGSLGTFYGSLYGAGTEATFSVPFISTQVSYSRSRLVVHALFYAPSISRILETFYESGGNDTLEVLYDSGFNDTRGFQTGQTGVHQLPSFIV